MGERVFEAKTFNHSEQADTCCIAAFARAHAHTHTQPITTTRRTVHGLGLPHSLSLLCTIQAGKFAYSLLPVRFPMQGLCWTGVNNLGWQTSLYVICGKNVEGYICALTTNSNDPGGELRNRNQYQPVLLKSDKTVLTSGIWWQKKSLQQADCCCHGRLVCNLSHFTLSRWSIQKVLRLPSPRLRFPDNMLS